MMKRFVSIWFPTLLTDAYALLNPAFKRQATVICAPSHNRLLVRNCNAEALNNGIRPGMVVADARALVPGILVVHEQAGLAEKLLLKIAQWCIRFTPAAAIDGKDGLVLDASGCTHLWGGEEKYLACIQQKFHARGYRVSIAMADTAGAAWALAHFHPGITIAPPGQHLHFIKDLPPYALRIEESAAGLLMKLGLKTIGDFIGLPRTVLLNRFGKELLVRIQQVIGEVGEAFEPVFPAPEWIERLPCPEPIILRAGIDIALQRLLDALCKQLINAGLGVRTLIFSFHRVDGSDQRLTISTTAATVNAQHLFRLFENRLAELAPGEGIELFLLEASRADNYQPRQEQFWAGLAVARQVSELVDRILLRLGNKSVQRFLPAAHHWPESSFRVAKELDERSELSWASSTLRPVQLNHQPEKIEVAAPIPDYPPMLFRYKGILHRIRKAEGPERIEREWWLDEGVYRDYYVLEDEDGARYWVFREGDGWFLSGHFA